MGSWDCGGHAGCREPINLATGKLRWKREVGQSWIMEGLRVKAGEHFCPDRGGGEGISLKEDVDPLLAQQFYFSASLTERVVSLSLTS